MTAPQFRVYRTPAQKIIAEIRDVPRHVVPQAYAYLGSLGYRDLDQVQGGTYGRRTTVFARSQVKDQP